jgi:hypothetical protein
MQGASMEVFALGMLGGSLVELVRWYKLRDAPEYPIYAKKAVIGLLRYSW